MPKLLPISTDELMTAIPTVGGSSFQFSAVRIADLGSTEYTLVDIAVDISGSVTGFKKQLLDSLKTIIEACKKSPRAENLMIRLSTFSDRLEEVHGFRLLNTIDPNEYQIRAGGRTALYSAAYTGLSAIRAYAETLYDQDFGVNGIAFVITDGMDNVSKETAKMVADIKDAAVTGEKIESLLTVLIGINVNDTGVSTCLKDFNVTGKFDQYVEADNATPETLAKLASFVSKSISSQSASLGTGGPSQVIPMTF